MSYLKVNIADFARIKEKGSSAEIVSTYSNKKLKFFYNPDNRNECIVTDEEMNIIPEGEYIAQFPIKMEDQNLYKFYKNNGDVILGRVREDYGDNDLVTSIAMYNSFSFTKDSNPALGVEITRGYGTLYSAELCDVEVADKDEVLLFTYLMGIKEIFKKKKKND